MYGESFQSVRIDQRCIFCKNGTASVQTHTYSENGQILKVPFPAHEDCLKKAKQVDGWIKWAWFLAVAAITWVNAAVSFRGQGLPIPEQLFGLIGLFGYFGPILYFTVGKNRRWEKKIKLYYESHRFGKAETRDDILNSIYPGGRR